MSKAFEKCLHDQIYAYIDSIYSNLNAALEKATVLSIQLLQWLKNGNTIWIKVDQFGYAKGLFTDLSKAFDRLVHDFLIAKLMVLLMSL